mgnify:CR=1 FL=1
MISENTSSKIEATAEASAPAATQTAKHAETDRTPAANEEALRRLPAFLEPELRATYGAGADCILSGFANARPTTLRANTLRATKDQVAAQLSAEGFCWRSVDWYRDAFILDENPNASLWDSTLIKEGLVYVQSLSSMLPPLFMRLGTGIEVLDMCAAPGGKTTQLAALLQGSAHIAACEQNAVRADKLEFNLRKQGAQNVAIMRQDARRLDSFFSFDRVLLDAPCSGSGTLSVHDPKLGKRFSEALVKDSCKKQAALLEKALEIVKPGGTVLYSTCSVLKRENEDIVSAALKKAAKKGRYVIDALDTEALAQQGVPLLPSTIEGAVTVCPTALYEGFFMCRITRMA